MITMQGAILIEIDIWLIIRLYLSHATMGVKRVEPFGRSTMQGEQEGK